ncbi:MAG TPA: glycosyltransferase family 4 protein [Anaerolineae bacterium]|nr:glycosyltransferase family 4 protein [Anaerolineae bacterium]
MRIGMLVDMYKPHLSGVTNHVALLKRTLEDMGHETFIFTFGEARQEDEPGVVRSPGVPLEMFVEGMHLSLTYSKEAQQVLRTMDVVHAHHPFISARLGLRYARPHGIPVVFTNHTRYDLYLQAYLPILPDGVGELMLKAYLPSLSRAVDLVVAPSKGVYQLLERIGVEMSRVALVPNGVDLRRFESPPEPLPREALGLTEEQVVVMYVGRLGPEKNLVFLLRAFRGVAMVYPQAHLVLVGDGPIREDLVAQTRELGLAGRVTFVGQKPYEEVPRYLAAADLFATASVTEVHPLSVIEAMAAGLPVVGVHSPGVGDTVESGVTGLLTEDEVTAFAVALGALVGNADLRRRMGQAARQASWRYDVRHTTRKLVAHYRHLVDQARRDPEAWQAQSTKRWRDFLERWREFTE